MNLREIRSLAEDLLGNPEPETVLPGSMLRGINVAQQVLASYLWNIDREKFLHIDTLAAVNAQSDYDSPVDLREYVDLLYAGFRCRRIPARKVNQIRRNRIFLPIKGVRQFYNLLGTVAGGTTVPGRSKIRLYPTPDDTANIERWYYRRPLDFTESSSYEGVATGGTTLTLVDALAPYNTAATSFANFWLYAEIRFTSGNNAGQRRRVSSWNPATSTFTWTDALPTAVAASDKYEIDQVSILPEELHHLMAYYAAALCAPRAGKDAAMFWDVWNVEVARLREAQVNNLEANIPGQSSQGVAGA